MIIAIITAGGIGTRMGLAIPKQFYEVDKKPLIVYTLQRFQESRLIDAICVVYLESYKKLFEEYKEKYNLTKIKWMVAGGETNQMSIYNGLKCLKKSKHVNNDDIVLVHDGIRPMINDEIINDSIEVCKKNGNAVAVTPCNEAMLFSENRTTSTKSINREMVWKTQTPHTMKFSEMFNLLESTLKKGIKNSVAICTMLIENGIEVHFSKGDNMNFKLTTPEDIGLFRGVLRTKKEDKK